MKEFFDVMQFNLMPKKKYKINLRSLKMLAGFQETKNNNNKPEMSRKLPLIPQLFLAVQEQIRLIQIYELLCRRTKRLTGGQLR